MSLSGTYVYTLSEQRRLVLPAAHRAELGARVLLTWHPNGTLLAMAPRRWPAFLTCVYEHREYYRSGAIELPIGKTTGRIQVPLELCEHAGLRVLHSVVITGHDGFLALQAAARFAREKARLETALLAHYAQQLGLAREGHA